MRAIKGILTQHGETAALLRLLVLTILQDESNHLLIGILIDLSIVEQVLEQSKCIGHVLGEAAEANSDCVGVHADSVVAGHLVELVLDLCGRELVRAEIVDVVGGHVVAIVVLLSELVAELQFEEAVFGVLLVDDGQALLCSKE